jgi:DNA-binding LacI/PurR family transcriptional regulator
MMRDFLAQNISFDGVVGGTHPLAIGAMFAIQEAGFKVPQDVAIAAFDDHLLNVLVQPSMTAIRIPNDEFGRLCAEKLFHLMTGKPIAEKRTQLQCDLKIRESSIR